MRAGLVLAGDLAADGICTVVLERATRRAEIANANGHAWSRGQAFARCRPEVLVSAGLELGLLRSPLHALPIPQRRLEELLEKRALEQGATVLGGHQVRSFDQGDTEATVHVTTPRSELGLAAQYLVDSDERAAWSGSGLALGVPPSPARTSPGSPG